MPDDCVPVENTLTPVTACKTTNVSVEAHLFPEGGHGNIVACIQSWPRLAADWLGRTFA